MESRRDEVAAEGLARVDTEQLVPVAADKAQEADLKKEYVVGGEAVVATPLPVRAAWLRRHAELVEPERFRGGREYRLVGELPGQHALNEARLPLDVLAHGPARRIHHTDEVEPRGQASIRVMDAGV